MTSNEILKADVLDILFNERNKQYGAYLLRKNYNKRLLLALCLSLSSVFLLLFLFQNIHSGAVPLDRPPVDSVVVHTLAVPPLKPLPPTPPPIARQAKPQPLVAQRKLVDNISIVSDSKKIADIMPPIDDLTHVAISDQTVLGKDVGPTQPEIKPEPGKGSGETGAEEQDAIRVERQPEFPGGMQAWVNFLNRNLRTPDELDPGEKRTVLIEFQVATDGVVTGFRVIQSAGSSLDNEVIRVLKKMPKWSPAIQNGHPVAVRFTQPVTFVGLEQ